MLTGCSPENLICPELAAARNSWKLPGLPWTLNNTNPTRPSRGAKNPASRWLRQVLQTNVIAITGSSDLKSKSRHFLDWTVLLFADWCFCHGHRQAQPFLFSLTDRINLRILDKQDARQIFFSSRQGVSTFFCLVSRRWWFRKRRFRHWSCSESTIINSAARLGCLFSHGWSSNNLPQ